MSASSDALDALFAPLEGAERFVVGQLGQSLDGRIATRTGDAHFVTGPGDIERLHRLRALVDAVVVGAGTVESDDPQLTVRRVEGENPVRVVLDAGGRLSPTLRVFSDAAAPTWWVRGEGRGRHGETGLPRHVEILSAPAWDDGRLVPQGVLALLRARGCSRILVEGGGRTVSSFLEAACLDRLHVTVAPLILGSGVPAFTLPEVDRLSEALRPPARTFPLGDDVVFDLDLSGG